MAGEPRRGSPGTGSRTLVRADHAHPVIPQNDHAFQAALNYIAYHYGIVLSSLDDMLDRYAGRLLGHYLVGEREARLRRIEAVYPEAAAEARMAGRRGT